jgi:hypothetical protein
MTLRYAFFSQRYGLYLFAILLSLVMLFSAGVAQSRNHKQDYTIYGTPVGHDKYMVLMANGIYDPNDPNYTPPDFEIFARDIMGWDDAEIAANQEKAKAFFARRFGIDPESPEHAGRVMMVPFMIDPRWQYRVYNSSGNYVPRQGWVIRDGGFQLIALDTNGVDLGGEFAGVHAPQGAIAAFGEYNILVEPALHKTPRKIVIHYESRKPVLQNSGFPLDRSGKGTLIAPLDVYHPEWGHGWAFAHITDEVLPDGKQQTNNRNIVTFPAGAAFPEPLQPE